MISSAKVNGVILPIVAFSLPLSQAMAVIGVPQGFVLRHDHGVRKTRSSSSC